MTGQSSILVTGAGGFIGGRIVEVLYETGLAEVRAGIRRWASAARVGRLPIEIVQCDVTSPEQVRAAMAGTSAVVHCAVGSRTVNVDGARILLEAARDLGVQRFIHVSTIDVYGKAEGVVPEDAPYQYTGKPYGDSKIDAEKLCHEFGAQGVPVVILRPTVVYGPFSNLWTVEFAERLRQPPWLLPENVCRGTCNLVYVDDMVRAVIAALERDQAVGHAFNVNGPQRPTWHEYFHALNDAMGLPPLVTASGAVSRARSIAMQPVRTTAKWMLRRFEPAIMAAYHRSKLAKQLMRRAEGTIRRTPTTGEFHMYSRRVSYETAKAEAMLGFRPDIDMKEGIAQSVAWLRHHGYLQATDNSVTANAAA